MKDFPIIKVVPALITGIILEKIFHHELSILIGASIFLLLFQVIFTFFRALAKFTFVRSFSLLITFVFLGAAYLNLVEGQKDEYPFKSGKIRKAVLYGKIEELSLPQNDMLSLIVSSDSLSLPDSNTKRLNVSTLCKVYEDTTRKLLDVYKNLSLGNKIKVLGTFSKPASKRNPGEFNYEKYLRTENIPALFSVYDIENIDITSDEINSAKNFISELRFEIQKRIKKYSSKKTAGLITGLLLADRSGIDYEIREQFINAGVIHVLAVSGLHVGFIAFIFYLVFNRFNIYARYILTIAGLLLFMVTTGIPPSVFRATVMAILLLFTFIFNRSYNSFNALTLAAFIILLVNPEEIFNPGFQLSFSAVLSILIFYPLFQRFIKFHFQQKSIRYILLFLSVSLAAQIGTLPFTLFYFHKISVISLLMNLFVIPIIAVIISVAVITLFVSFFSSWLALIYGSANNFFSDLLFRIVASGGNNEFSFIYINEFSLLDVLIFYFFVTILFITFQYFHSVLSKSVLMILIFLNIYIFSLLDNKEYLPPKILSVAAIDVGQGDAFLVKFPNGKTALIDAGNRNEYYDSGKRIKTLLQKFDIDKIDFGFVSHIDADHYGGFLTLVKENLIGIIFKPETDSSSEKEKEFEYFLQKNNVKYMNYKKMIIKFPDTRLYSLINPASREFKRFDSNNRSGVIKICFGKTSFLFTGDAEFEEEERLIDIYGDFMKSNFLKVGHHGSKKGSSSQFINEVDPEYALISAGYMNQFRHPAKEVLSRLQAEDIRILRTDLNGAVIINSTGEKINFVNWKKFENRYALN